MKRERLTGPALHRAATGVEVLDAEKRTFRISFSSDEPYLRSSWFDEPWLEVLGHDADEVDMSRIDGGAAPLLWGHDSYSRDAHIGVVERAWLEGGRGHAEVRLSSRADLDSLWSDIQDGVIRNVSVGYQINERTLLRANSDGPNEYRVTRWQPMELSLVSVPADPSVGVGRNADDNAQRFTITNMEKSMDTTTETPVQTPAAPAASVASADEIRAESAKAERARIVGITDAVRAAKLPDEMAEQLIADGTPIELARAKVLEKLGDRPQPKEPTHIGITSDQSEKTRAAGEAWMLHRANEKVPQDALNGNPFRGMSMLDMARDSLERAGVRTRGLLAREIAQRAISHSTSDFPIIFQNVMHKTLVNAYTAVPDVWRTFCRVGTLSDFRPHYRYRPGSFGNLATVAENGTYTYGTLPDAERESITGATKGKLLNLSRQMIINDDLGAFTDAARAMGRGAARTVEADVFTLLAANPTMGDTGALFNATVESTAGGHANLNASGAAPTVAGFDAVRQAMGAHLDVGGNDYVAARPAVWVGPLAHEGQANVVNESQYDIDQSNKTSYYPNKSRGMLRQIVGTPRLTGNIWYVFADPNEEPVIEVAFLDGEQAPYVEMQDGFEVDGVTWKVRLDYAVGAVGWRGGYKVTW